jgi:hypothetical protein
MILMKSMHIAVLLAWTAAASTVSAQSPMREGRWEITSQMEMANMPVKMPEMKTIRCVTPEQSKDPAKALPSPSSNPNGKDQSCKVSDYKAVGNTVSWKVACTGAQSLTGSGEMVFAGDSYTGTMKMTMQQGEMSMKYSGKRLGDCTP